MLILIEYISKGDKEVNLGILHKRKTTQYIEDPVTGIYLSKSPADYEYLKVIGRIDDGIAAELRSLDTVKVDFLKKKWYNNYINKIQKKK